MKNIIQICTINCYAIFFSSKLPSDSKCARIGLKIWDDSLLMAKLSLLYETNSSMRSKIGDCFLYLKNP